MIDFITLLAAPLSACLILVGVHAYFGIHVLAREVIFVDLSLAQIAALGTALAFLAGFPLEGEMAYLFSLATTFVGAAIFSITRVRNGRISQEAIIGIVFAVSAAAGILVVDRAPHGAEHIKHMLVGSILWVNWEDVVRIGAIYSVVGLFHWVYRKPLLTISFNEEEAVRRGLSIRLWDFLFYASFGFVITSSVRIAGVLLVFTFLIVPAVFASLLLKSLGQRLLVAWVFGFAASALGCALSYVADLPTGAAIVCLFGCILLCFGLLRWLVATMKRGA